jgi:hypothetical protein
MRALQHRTCHFSGGRGARPKPLERGIFITKSGQNLKRKLIPVKRGHRQGRYGFFNLNCVHALGIEVQRQLGKSGNLSFVALEKLGKGLSVDIIDLVILFRFVDCNCRRVTPSNIA